VDSSILNLLFYRGSEAHLNFNILIQNDEWLFKKNRDNAIRYVAWAPLSHFQCQTEHGEVTDSWVFGRIHQRPVLSEAIKSQITHLSVSFLHWPSSSTDHCECPLKILKVKKQTQTRYKNKT